MNITMPSYPYFEISAPKGLYRAVLSTILVFGCASIAYSDTTWNCGTGVWDCNCNWTNCTPNGDGDHVCFTGPSDTIDLVGANNADLQIRDLRINNAGSTFDFIDSGGTGTIQPRNNVEGDSGTFSFTCGASLTMRCAGDVYVGRVGGGSSTMILDGTGGGGDVCLPAVGNQMKVGFACSSTGQVTMTNAASICAAGSFFVGENGTGTITMSGGSTINVCGVFALGECCCGTGALTMSGGSVVNASCAMLVGKCGDGILTMSGCSVVNASAGISVGQVAGSSGTLVMCCSTINFPGSNFEFAFGGQAYATITNSVICASGGDVQFARNNNSTANIISSGTTWCIGEDLIISHQNGGAGTAVFSGDCITIGNALAVGRCKDTVVTFNCGTTLTSLGTADLCVSPQPTQLGNNCNACVHVNIDGCGTVITLNDPGGIDTSNCLTIEFTAGGKLTGSAQLKNFRGNSEIRGFGTIGNPIDLDGGTFSAALGETLVIGDGNTGVDGISAGTSSVIDFNGVGTIEIGADNVIEDGVDIDLNGGNLKLAGSVSDTVGNLTLRGDSRMEMGGNGTQSDITFAGAASWAANVDLDITSWDGGTASELGTNAAANLALGSTIRFSTDPTSDGNFDINNITVNGSAATLVAPGDGFWYIVGPAPVPEPSTWVFGLSMLSFSFWHMYRRHISTGTTAKGRKKR